MIYDPDVVQAASNYWLHVLEVLGILILSLLSIIVVVWIIDQQLFRHNEIETSDYIELKILAASDTELKQWLANELIRLGKFTGKDLCEY